ncbi:MAG: P pilus assembly/Cpx signaling pathway, periplasmic inhibitor/zinc-resistance associated protein [Cyanobacteria bacterium P01_E01_bin.42]
MKFKSILVLVGTIASLSLATALPASAQRAEGGKRPDLAAALGLSETQQTQLEELRAEMRSEMDDVLTAEQKAALENARSEGQRPGRGAMRSLNLTQAQRQQMRSLREDFQDDLEDILTDEQVQRLQEMRQSRRDRR